MNHRIAIILALISVIVALAPAIAASPIISIDSYTTEVSSNVTVQVKITNASAVAGGSVKITFNPAIVNVQAVTPGDFGIPTSNINNANGSLRVAASRAITIGIDEAILANISFLGMSEGYTALNIENAILNFEEGNTTTPEASDGSIDVRTPSDTDADSDSDTDSHSGDGYADSIAGATDDDLEKEKVLSNEPTAINIGSYTVGVDSNVIVPVEITHASAVAGGSANITFNPLFATAQAILPGDFGTPIANINNDAGFVYIACASPTAVGKETAKLAIVRFKGVSKGLTSLDIQDATLNDERGNIIALETTSGGEIKVRAPISPPALTPTPFATTNENITTPPAPLPGERIGLFALITVIVACLALAGGAIALLRRRKIKR